MFFSRDHFTQVFFFSCLASHKTPLWKSSRTILKRCVIFCSRMDTHNLKSTPIFQQHGRMKNLKASTSRYVMETSSSDMFGLWGRCGVLGYCGSRCFSRASCFGSVFMDGHFSLGFIQCLQQELSLLLVGKDFLDVIELNVWVANEA